MARTDPDRTMTAAGLARLLARLDPEMEGAARAYEELRRALVKFFECRGARPSDECADEALDRLARRLAEDTRIIDVRKYAHGIARLVLLERHRRPSLASLDGVKHLAAGTAAPADGDDELQRDCFDRCMAGLSAENRSLVLRYYEGERDTKIANRRRLAESLGLTENALRSRVQRLRDHLERCVDDCLSAEKDRK